MDVDADVMEQTQWLTLDQAVEASGRSRSTLERAIRDERLTPGSGLRHTKPGGRPRSRIEIKREWLNDWLNISREAGDSRASARGTARRAPRRRAA